MIERQDDNNPWADKLSEIKLPKASDSWKAMEVLLDKTLPMERRGDRRRLLLLILLLLLLIGVCNCPGSRMLNQTNSVNPERSAPPEPEKKRIGNKTIANKETGKEDTGKEVTGGEVTGSEGKGKEVAEREPDSKVPDSKETGKNQKEANGSNRKVIKRERKAGKWQKVVSRRIGEDASGGKSTVENGENKKETKDKTVKEPGVNETTLKAKVNKEREPAGKKRPNLEKGWAAGIGLNHFFTLGQQQHSDYNSGGTSGGLRDYIPVPMVRYYFSKKLFIQLEAQFNTPQYTRKDLLASQPPADTISSQQKLQNSVYIKKLFYFNLPLSIHFSPAKNLYLGTGLQFSRLTNGVGLIEDKLLTVGASDSIKQIQVKSIKGDSVYKKIRTGEFRFLVDISYQYKNLVAGARYNQALTNFIQVRISDAQVTQARNSSLQLYLRYILWDQRNHRGNRNQGNLP
ncbi:porin family protein [Flavitalea flava]